MEVVTPLFRHYVLFGILLVVLDLFCKSNWKRQSFRGKETKMGKHDDYALMLTGFGVNLQPEKLYGNI